MAGHPLIYDAFGQRIASDLPLPWAPAPPDHLPPTVWLHRSPSPLTDLPDAPSIHRFAPPPNSPERPLHILLNPDHSLDIIDPAGRLRVTTDRHIFTDWLPTPQATSWLTSALEHIALPLLWLREPPTHTTPTTPSRTILHGSAVVIGQRAWVFLGASGAGKSTTVRELVTGGATLLADDLALIERDRVWPGSGAVRLWDGFEHLTHATSFELLRDGERVKHWLRFPNAQRETSPQPLGGIVCLERTPEAPTTGTLIAVESPQRAALLLLGQALALSSPPTTWQRERFEAVCALAREARVWRLLYCASDNGAPLHLEALNTLWAHTHG